MAGANDFTGNFISSTYQRLLQLSGSGQITDGTGSVVNLLQVTASYALSSPGGGGPETDPIFTAKSASLATTGSNSFSGSQYITGSLVVTTGITGSLFGTASWSISSSRAISSSFAISSSYSVRSDQSAFADQAQNAVFSTNAGSANTATTAGSATTSLFATTADTASAVEIEPSSSALPDLVRSRPFLVPFNAGNGNKHTSELLETSLEIQPERNVIIFNPKSGRDAQLEIGDSNTNSDGQLIVYGPLWAQSLNILPTTIKFVDTVNTASFNKLTDLSFINSKLVLSTGSFSGSFSGSFFGTSSWAISSSRAVTSSYSLFALTASYALNGGTGGATAIATLTQSSPASTWVFTHNLGIQYPIVTVYDNTNKIVIPQEIEATDSNNLTIYFPNAISGTAVAAAGAFSSLSGSYVLTSQTSSFVQNSQTSSMSVLSSSFALTASYLLGSATIDTSSLVTTSSFNSFTSSYNTGSFTGSLTGALIGTASFATNALTANIAPNYVLISATSSMLASYVLASQTSSFFTGSFTGSFIGSLHGTASWAQSSSQALTASFVTTAQTASYILNAVTSSYALTASYAMNAGSSIDTGSLVTTASFNNFTSSYYLDSSSFDSRINNITIDTSSLVTTASFNSFTASYTTGSFTGSFTGSLLGTATTASYAIFNPYIVTIGSRVYTDDTFITAGSKGYKHVGYNANIIKARTVANTNGYIDINVKRNNITLGTISLSNQSGSLDTTLTGWTTQLNTDDLLEFYVSQSSTYITDISIFIDIQARQ